MSSPLTFTARAQGDTAGWDVPLKTDLTNLHDDVGGILPKLLLNPRGPWSGAASYAVGDSVTYQGGTYYAQVANTNVNPSNPATWGVLARAGSAARGLRSARPAAATAGAGALYFETDTLVLWESDGSTWARVGADLRYLPNQGTLWRDSMARGTTRDNMSALTTAVEYMAAVPMFDGDVVGNLFFWSGSTAWVPGTGTPHLFFTLRKADGTLVATTADTPAASWATSSRLSMPIARNAAGGAISSYTITESGLWYVGIVAVAGAGGNVPTLHGISSLTSTAGGSPTGNLLRLAGTAGSALTDPASAPAGPLTPTGSGSFAYCGAHA